MMRTCLGISSLSMMRSYLEMHGRVHDVMPSKDGLVRKVKILIADESLDHKGRRIRALSFLESHIHKLVLLLEKDRGDISAEEPSYHNKS